jgi:hypothetical protein
VKEILAFQSSYDLQNTAHQFKQMSTEYTVAPQLKKEYCSRKLIIYLDTHIIEFAWSYFGVKTKKRRSKQKMRK